MSNTSSSPVDAIENRACDETLTESETRKISSVVSNGNARRDPGLQKSRPPPSITSHDSNLSTRTVRFDDDVDFDFIPDSPNLNDSLTSKFEYRRRESTI